MRRLLLSLGLAKPRKKRARLLVRTSDGRSYAFGDEVKDWKLGPESLEVYNTEGRVIFTTPRHCLNAACGPITIFENSWW